MYVRWKVLLGLGTAFWLLLCLLDYLPIKHIDHIFLQKQQQPKIEIKEISPLLEQPKRDHPEEGNYGFIKVMFWNLVAFASTITVCFALKTISSKLNIINNHVFLLDHNDKISALKKSSSSRIPIPITSKTSSTDIRIENAPIHSEEFREADYNKSCPNLFGGYDFHDDDVRADTRDKKIWSIKIMEKHCSKLREEMINLQATSIKEQSAVAKRLETLAKEKRELTRQFNGITKENRSLKGQIDEMIEERTLLIKRLECATKEMKNATKNKKTTVAKLDEAMANAESLKTNLEQIKRDKTLLEDKLIILDAEYRRLKSEVDFYKQKEMELEKRLSQKKNFIDPFQPLRSLVEFQAQQYGEHNVDTQTELSDYNPVKSEEDIKKVQQKLLKLEKSLESFKLRHNSKELAVSIPNIPKEEKIEDVPVEDSPVSMHEEEEKGEKKEEEKEEESKEISQEVITADEKDSTESIIAKSEDSDVPTICIYSEDNSKISVEKQPSTISICTEPDCPLEHSECMRAECFLRRKMEEAEVSSSGEDIRSAINYKDYTNAKKKMLKLKTSISDDRLSVISELGASTADESGDDWNEPKRRFVTRSPAFQKFLKEAIEARKLSKSSIDASAK